MPSWPYFIWVVLLCMIFITILTWGVSMFFKAPLEEAAEWAKTPNPAKAPWYFIGLQELLVYFDPWIAGVIIPNQILIGLILIPYVDTAPEVQGYYNYSRRMFQKYFKELGIIKYSLVMTHVLLTLGVVGKILLRLLFGIKYVIVTPWFNI